MSFISITGPAMIGFLALSAALGNRVADAADAGSGLCAHAPQRQIVSERFAAPSRGLVEELRNSLGLTEAAIMSGLPAGRAIGVSGDEFSAVWESLRDWPDALVLIRKAGHVFEVHGPVHAGTPSKVSQYFNLDPAGPGMAGHLRPDLIAAIYAVTLPGREGDEHGVIFYDAGGEAAFGVYVPSEHAKPAADVLDAFERTRTSMRAMRRACPDDASESNP